MHSEWLARRGFQHMQPMCSRNKILTMPRQRVCGEDAPATRVKRLKTNRYSNSYRFWFKFSESVGETLLVYYDFRSKMQQIPGGTGPEQQEGESVMSRSADGLTGCDSDDSVTAALRRRQQQPVCICELFCCCCCCCMQRSSRRNRTPCKSSSHDVAFLEELLSSFHGCHKS